MAVCFFGKTYDSDHLYKCEYEKRRDQIVVKVDYDISEEIEAVNGIKSFGPNTKYEDRDILIIDHDRKSNYLLKDAYYSGQSSVYGSPDGGTRTTFTSDIFFHSKSYQALAELKDTPKIKTITIVSEDLKKYIAESSLTRIEDEDKLVISLRRKASGESRKVGAHNIEEIILHDYWSGGFNKEHDICFDITGNLKLRLFRRANYTEVYRYVYEMLVFLRLYTKNKFVIDGIKVSVDGTIFDMFFPIRNNLNHHIARKNIVENSVQTDLIEFLERCYSSIPYRNGKSDIRNIPYIILDKERSIEDSFLTYYRFIECFYKKKNIPNIRTEFISYSLKNNYVCKGKKLPAELEKIANEIVTLRNHYVHSGYFIRNESLRITFDDSSKNYTAKADIDWIYKRMKILYDCSIDIIFRDMLGYEKYSFS